MASINTAFAVITATLYAASKSDQPTQPALVSYSEIFNNVWTPSFDPAWWNTHAQPLAQQCGLTDDTSPNPKNKYPKCWSIAIDHDHSISACRPEKDSKAADFTFTDGTNSKQITLSKAYDSGPLFIRDTLPQTVHKIFKKMKVECIKERSDHLLPFLYPNYDYYSCLPESDWSFRNFRTFV